jgi:hypothetical protein
MMIESSPQAQAAFAGGIGSGYYSTNTFANLPPGPIPPLSVLPEPTSTSSPTLPPTATPLPTQEPTNTPYSAPTVTPTLPPSTATPAPTLGPTVVPTVAPVGLGNPSFEETGSGWLTPWIFRVGSGAFAQITQDGASRAHGTYSARIQVSKRGGNWENVALEQESLSFAASNRYLIKFWAKASANRTMRVIVKQGYGAGTEYIRKRIDIKTSWQAYTIDFTSPVSDGNLRLCFSAADATGTLWLDEISVQPQP